MKKRIAIVDDEPDIVELIALHLRRAGFEVEGYQEAEPFLKSLSFRSPDLLILDLMLPDADGLDVCRYMKRKEELASIPVIMLTAKGTETDKVLGLELGADDYVTKPFSPQELVARVKAVLRRPIPRKEEEKLEIGDILVIYPSKHEVYVEGKRVNLTLSEFKILHLLSSRKGRVFPRDQILDHLWGQEKAVIDRTVDIHIHHLREKLGKAAAMVKNVRGVGYKLEE
ncbi:MAG: response regulator [Candidatus Aminicenantales bacterium]